MKRLALVAVLASLSGDAQAQVVGPPAAICNQISTGTTAQQVVTAAAGKTTSICGWTIIGLSGGAGIFQLAYGTGSVCGTGTTNVSPPVAAGVIAQGGSVVDHLPYVYFSLPSGTNLCVTADTNVAYAIYFGQY